MLSSRRWKAPNEMKISRVTLVRGVSWTVIVYALTQLVRFGSNLVLTRLLSPELFGIIAIVHGVRIGIELVSDVGVGQSMVVNKLSDDPKFYNTAWSLQLVRGCILWVLSLLVALPLAHFYEAPILQYLLPVAALPFILSGLNSMGGYIAQKRMQFVRINLFEFLLEFIASSVNVAVAFVSPTIWALISGVVVASVARTIGSYFLVPGIRHRFCISREFAWQIAGFSKWILLSSIVFFLSSNFDSFYLGKASSLTLLGVYGIARALSQQIVNLVSRLAGIFVFPIIASSNQMRRQDLRDQVKTVRGAFLLITAGCFSLIAVGSDFLVSYLYDQRYQAAAWMLPILIAGAWFSTLCTVNESILLGLGKPVYGAMGNCVKFIWLLIGVPIAFARYDAIGVVVIVAISDLWRYFPVLFGQVREKLSFGTQDLLVTLSAVGMVMMWEFLRVAMGLKFTFV
jgi:O-antigen/teichoic acid export membrane protein